MLLLEMNEHIPEKTKNIIKLIITTIIKGHIPERLKSLGPGFQKE